MEALTFVLFGKAFRDIKKDQLINNINKKNCLVECNLIGNNGAKVKIRRGLKPNIFEIYENDKLVDQHSEVKDYQNYLETNIIGMNYIIFSQTVIISKTKYTPFMKLRAGERRQFVESVLNLELFGDMLKAQTKNVGQLKTKEGDIKTDIKIESTKMNGYIESYRRINSLYEKSKRESAIERQKEIDFFNEKSLQLLDENKMLLAKIIDENPYAKKYNKKIQLENKKRSIVEAINQLNANIKKYEKIVKN
jgi:DNA repair exonuclease SbcCD ATPase subunit